MLKLFQFLRDWSEVWALLIPLIIILIYKPLGRKVRPLVFYVIIAFLLNFLAVFVIEYYYLAPLWLNEKGNNLYYNLHSFIMVVFFSWYILTIRPNKYVLLLKAFLAIYILFVLINFAFFEPTYLLSSRHFTAGSIVLLLMCLSYFFHSMQDDSQINWIKHPSFIICTGVCLYQAVTFFVFLFIYPLYDDAYNKNLSFAMLMMRVYQVVFVLFCILIAIGLYHYRYKQKKDADLNNIIDKKPGYV